jgi:hypothetical protein
VRQLPVAFSSAWGQGVCVVWCSYVCAASCFLVDGSRVSLRVSWWRGTGGIDGVMVSSDLSDEELYDKFSDRLVRFAATVVGAADAEDVMTDGVVGAMQSGTVALGDRGARRTGVASLFGQIVSASSSKAAATRSRT